MATRTSPRRLTLSFRAAQIRRAGLVAALVSIYFRDKVRITDPSSVDNWLALMIPKVLENHDLSAQDAARFGDTVRRLELPNTVVPYRFQPLRTINEDQLRASLQSVGVKSYLKKVREIERLPDRFDKADKAAMVRDANQIAAGRVAAAVSRHVQNGSRRTLEEGAKRDPMTIGFVRVTQADPCYFCAILASRGLDGGIYAEDSFDLSDARFTPGMLGGNAKVHDSCGCSLKPVYQRSDEILMDNQKFTDMWANFSGDGDSDSINNFRRHYEGREAYLDKS